MFDWVLNTPLICLLGFEKKKNENTFNNAKECCAGFSVSVTLLKLHLQPRWELESHYQHFKIMQSNARLTNMSLYKNFEQVNVCCALTFFLLQRFRTLSIIRSKESYTQDFCPNFDSLLKMTSQ